MEYWTIQMPIVWQELEQKGSYYARKDIVEKVLDEDYIPLFRYGYYFIIEQMEKKDIPRPSPDHYPIWAWAIRFPHEKPRKRKVRKKIPRGQERLFLQFTIPDELVLLSDFDRYFFPLNYWYLAKTEEEEQQFLGELEEHNLDFFRQKPLPNDYYHQQVVKSWERIFDIETDFPIEGINRKQRVTQATFWELKMEWITKYYFFKGTRKKSLV